MTWDDEPGTWVVYGNSTGWSDEHMRFGSKGDAELWIAEAHASGDPEEFGMRYEP